jgi:predicted tellurium resistance membrane protein TerC
MVGGCSVEVLLAFLMATVANTVLGVDGGVLADTQIRKLEFVERTHLWVRSLTLFAAACIRVAMIFAVSSLAFLLEPQSDWWWLPNRWFSEHPEALVWRHLLLFLGAGVVMAIVIYEYWHGFQEAAYGPHGHHGEQATETKAGFVRGLRIALALLGVQLLLGIFGVDQVFLMMSLMDIDTQFGWMVSSILLANLIMIVGMVPISRIIRRSPHTKFLTLSMLIVIAVKLAVDGSGGHFSDGLMMFILFMLLINDGAQAFRDRLVGQRLAREQATATA